MIHENIYKKLFCTKDFKRKSVPLVKFWVNTKWGDQGCRKVWKSGGGGRASSYVGRAIFPLWLKYLGLTDMGGKTLVKMKKKSIWPHLWYRFLFFAQHFFYFNLKHASHFKCSKWDFKRDNAIKIIYLWSCLQKTATYITFLWYLDHVPPMNFRLDFVSSSK